MLEPVLVVASLDSVERLLHLRKLDLLIVHLLHLNAEH